MLLDTVETLLSDKNSKALVSIGPSAMVEDAVRIMNGAKIGAVVVIEDNKLVGIFTERDVLVRVVGGGRDPKTTRVSEVMTSSVNCIGPKSSAGEAMQQMSESRHRHMPVVDGERVRGLVSMGDVTRWMIRSQQDQLDVAIRTVRQMGYGSLHANRR